MFLRADMEALPAFAQPFDVVFSSLAVHYVKDFPKLCAAVYTLLTPGGAFVFSQENPLTTAPSADEVWTRDENGGYLHYNLAAYSTGGRRTIHWFVDGVVKYHRTFSDVVNALAQAGFVVTAMREPIPSEADLERDPTLARKLAQAGFPARAGEKVGIARLLKLPAVYFWKALLCFSKKSRYTRTFSSSVQRRSQAGTASKS